MKRIIGAYIAVALCIIGCESPVTDSKVPVSGISVTPETLNLAIGESANVSAAVSPGDASNKAFTWSSSDEDVAFVTAEGLVTGVSGGTADIVATTTDGAKTDVCAVTVFNNYAVTFNSDGGSPVAAQDLVEGSLVTRPSVDPTKNGYSFDGWYADSDKTILWDFENNIIEDNTVIYAKWVLVTYSVTYELDGGTNTIGNPTTYTIESSTIVLASATKASFAFAGWYTDDSFENPITQIVTGTSGNLILYAKWAPYHTVTFDANGGTGDMSAQSLPEGIAATLNANTFTAPTSTKFAGWSEDPDATTATWTDGGSFTCGAANVTLYAVWKSLFDYTVSGSNATITGFSNYYAFEEAITIPSVIDGYTVTAIEEWAFYGEIKITSITLPATLLTIGRNAFYNCTKLTTITIPASVTLIEDYVFSDCPELESINVATANANYCSVNGVLYNKTKTTLIQYPETKGGAAVIDAAVTIISPAAFRSNKLITSVTLPAGVVTISTEAFYRCSALESITFPSTLQTIGNQAFYECTELTNLSFPASLQSIGNYVFRKCTGLTSITFSVGLKTIGAGAFAECSSLSSLTLPSGMTTINDSAFTWCTSLSEVTIGEGVTGIYSDAFRSCRALQTVNLPSTISAFSDRVFLDTPMLTTINVASGGASLSSTDGVLYNGAKTILMRFPSARNASAHAYPATLVSLRENSFEGYQGDTLTVPEGVTSVGEGSFSASNLVSLTLPSSLTFIGTHAAANSQLLESVTINAITPPDLGQFAPFGGSNAVNLKIYVPAGSVAAYQSAPEWVSLNIAQYVVSQ